MQETMSIVAVSGNTYPVKDQLKKAGFRFRRTSCKTLRNDGDNAILDAGFSYDTPIWYVQTDDVATTLDLIRNLAADLRIKVDGQSVETEERADTSPAEQKVQHVQRRMREESRMSFADVTSENWQDWDDESGPGDSTLPSRYFQRS